MGAVGVARAAVSGLQVPGSALQEFEPKNLGTLRPRFRRLASQIAGRRQTEIRLILETEAAALDSSQGRQEALALRASVLILRDYVLSGYYPVHADGRLFLAPVFESDGLTEGQRRAALTGLYRKARDRALVERDRVDWIRRVSAGLDASAYDPAPLIASLQDAPPAVNLRRAVTNEATLDARGLWRAVRATWSMGPEASAPGREVAFLIEAVNSPETPLGILQFRNVVPEIRARDAWLGTSVGSHEGPTGLIGRLAGLERADALEKLRATRSVMDSLLACVVTDGIGGRRPSAVDVAKLADVVRSRQVRYREERRDGTPTAHDHLAVIKRAETAMDLLRGLGAIDELLTAGDHPLALLSLSDSCRRDLDAGLTKIWHYHMGFVAMELSVCGAAPPFGPARTGKLAAALAGSRDVVEAWGADRPLGEIASKVYSSDVRSAVPNPGPLVVFTSGLFPGHSAQYNRVSSGRRAWQKIGETSGFGSFHIGVDTLRALGQYNEAVDGYRHVSRKFGEGSGPRFRAAGRALAHLGLPDLRRHETRRPLYALPLVDDPGAVILGWTQSPPRDSPSSQTIAAEWWNRWLAPRKDELLAACAKAPDLRDELRQLSRLT